MNPLRQAAEEYLTMRRGLGFKLHRSGKALLNFITFLEQHRATHITLPLALAWAKQPVDGLPSTWAQRLSFVRIFARYRSAADSRTEIPPDGLLPFRPQRARPYLYSDKEIRELLRQARQLPGHPLRPWTYYCFLGLLSVSGLRVGEAQSLRVQDIDLKAGVLTVRGAKFGKDRLIPLHASTRRVLARYIARRQRMLSIRPGSDYLFLSSRGNPLDGGDIRRTFYGLSRQIGLRGPSDRHGPRLHDMRHRFASRTLLRWYRSGQDPERRLPLLSAYLGHAHWSDTFWYLSALPELMREAMSRLEQHWEQRT